MERWLSSCDWLGPSHILLSSMMFAYAQLEAMSLPELLPAELLLLLFLLLMLLLLMMLLLLKVLRLLVIVWPLWYACIMMFARLYRWITVTSRSRAIYFRTTYHKMHALWFLAETWHTLVQSRVHSCVNVHVTRARHVQVRGKTIIVCIWYHRIAHNDCDYLCTYLCITGFGV